MNTIKAFSPNATVNQSIIRSIAVVSPDYFRQRIQAKGVFVKFMLTEETQEFIAKYLGDLSKAIITVGFASYFFKDLPWFLRIGFPFLAVVFLITSVIIIENKGE